MPEANSKKTVLVTGGAGFIGAHLCERLLKEGARVVCVDNFVTSHVRNIDALLPNPDFQFLRLDANQPYDLEKFSELSAFKIPFHGIQEIYHLACPTSIKKFDEFKTQTLLSNSIGNFYALEIARKYKAKIVLASSSVVYGARQNGTTSVTESDRGVVDHLTPRACYDEGKRYSETMFETYRQAYGVEAKIARIFRTYGPKMPLNDGHLIPDFVLNALDNKDLVIYGEKAFSTSLIYVTDVVDGLMRVINAPADSGPVNIGSDVDMKISDVAKMVIEATGSSSKIVYEPALPFLSELALPRIEKAKELGWLPLVRLEDGLNKTIEYLKANRLLLTNV
jgi:UDP-glucuronate decarboxylase